MKSVPQANTAPSRRRGHKRGDGEGTIHQRGDGLWVASVMVGYRVDGKPDRRYLYAKTRADVQLKLDALRKRTADGLLGNVELERTTFTAFLDRWLEAIKGSIRPRTWERYEEIATHHLRPTLGRLQLRALRPDHLQRLYAEKRQAGLSPRTVHHIHAVLHRALGQAMRWGAIPRNPADIVDKPRAPKLEINPPTSGEVRRLLDSAWAAEDRTAALWTVAVYSGCRLGELLALQWNDVDLDRGTITIRRTLERVTGTTPVYGEPKTSRSRRTVTLPAVAIDGLRTWKADQNIERLATGPNYGDYGLVFSTQIGTPLSGRNAHRFFKLALARAGLSSSVRVHDLRHFAATLMLSAGVHPKVASERLGHSTVGITLDLYSHAVEGLDADAAERMARAMGAPRV